MRRRLFLIMIGVGMLVGVLGLVFGPSREPEYRGKRLSEWVEDRRIGHFERDDAVRHIGTNAIPYLMKWIRYEPTKLKTKCIEFSNWLLLMARLNRSLDDRKWVRAFGAVEGLSALRPEADVILPRLCRVLNDPDAVEGAQRAVQAIERFDDAGLPLLVGMMTNGPQRWRAYLTNVVRAINDEQEWKRRVSTNAIRETYPQW